jgi:hypothetical protein
MVVTLHVSTITTHTAAQESDIEEGGQAERLAFIDAGQ